MSKQISSRIAIILLCLGLAVSAVIASLGWRVLTGKTGDYHKDTAAVYAELSESEKVTVSPTPEISSEADGTPEAAVTPAAPAPANNGVSETKPQATKQNSSSEVKQENAVNTNKDTIVTLDNLKSELDKTMVIVNGIVQLEKNKGK